MIVNENGWGDKKAPVAKEAVKDVRKAKLTKLIIEVEEDLAELKEVIEDAEQE